MDQSINTCVALGPSLPLIFVGGRPACVDKMTVPQLRRFIPFMLECEGQGHEIPSVDKPILYKPSWWPEDMEYSESILTANDISADELQNKLREIVRRCYENYCLTSILSLSSMLSSSKNMFGFVRVEENENGTCNVISCSNRLVVTTRTSVVKYDEDATAEMTVEIAQNVYNRPILNLLRTAYPERKYNNGRVKVPNRSLKLMPQLNPEVKLTRAAFVIPKGLKSKDANCARDNNNKVFSEDCCAVSKPLLNGLIHDFEIQENRIQVTKPRKLTKAQEKTAFLEKLGLGPRKTAASKSKIDDRTSVRCEMILKQMSVPTISKKKKRSKKPVVNPKPKPVSSFFKTHRIPFTSGLGLDIIRQSDTGRCDNTATVDQFCSKRNSMSPKLDQAPCISTLKKNIINEEDWVHRYSFNAEQKLRRNSEIILGLNSKSWGLLNQCRDIRVNILEVDPKDYISTSKRTIGSQCSQPPVLPPEFISGERPVIKIKNIFDNPKYAIYFQK